MATKTAALAAPLVEATSTAARSTGVTTRAVKRSGGTRPLLGASTPTGATMKIATANSIASTVSAGSAHRCRNEPELRKAKTLHAGVELAAAQAEQPGSPALVAAGLCYRALDELALDGLEIHTLRRELSARRGRRGRWCEQGVGGQERRRPNLHPPSAPPPL